MKIFYRLFRQDPDSREGIITMTSGLGIVINILIAGAKVIIGALTSSIAILSEGVNNAADAVTSVLTLIGARLGKKHPDARHPFGYGRIEYLASLVIAALILSTGVEMLINAVKLIFHPEPVTISVTSLIIVAATALIKFAVGLYTIRMGKKAESSALLAVGEEGRNDAFSSVITIVSSVIFLIFGFSLDAYAGVLIALLIIKAGGELLFRTVSDLLGRPGEKELADRLYGKILETKGVISAADMMLHNYGPEAWSGSVNVEIDQKKTVGEVYRVLHDLQLRIMHEEKVTMVFGIYAVDEDNRESKELRRTIAGFTREEEHIRSFHAVYYDESAKRIYCDFIVDYALRNWEELTERFTGYMREQYPECSVELTVETEYVG